jgi:hypothetical protein
MLWRRLDTHPNSLNFAQRSPGTRHELAISDGGSVHHHVGLHLLRPGHNAALQMHGVGNITRVLPIPNTQERQPDASEIQTTWVYDPALSVRPQPQPRSIVVESEKTAGSN